MIDEAIVAIRSGGLAIVPTDTVYGLATTPYRDEPVHRLLRAKGRREGQPIALVAASLDLLFESVPELRGTSGAIAAALLPGPYTLVLPNPGRRYPWLTGNRPETIGVRVPRLGGPGGEVLERVGAYAATSANLPGESDPATLDDVPAVLQAAAQAAVDGGPLPGTPSTVLDFTGPEPLVLRAGAASAADALHLVASVV